MKKYVINNIFIILFFFIMTSYSDAAKMRIAVMDLQPRGMSKSTASMVSDLIRTEMINIGKFVIIERAQMDTIMKEQGFQQTGCTDVDCAVQVGKMLSAKKMLVGTIMKLGGRIIINARIVDVEKGIAEFGQKQDAKSEADLYDAVSKFANKLSKRIKGTGAEEEEEEEEEEVEIKLPSKPIPEYKITNYVVMITGAYLLPQQTFADMAGAGYGANLNFIMNNFYLTNGVLTVSTGYYTFEGAEDWIDSVQTVPISAYYGYSLRLFKNFRMTPSLGAGYLVHMVSHDENGESDTDEYSYTTNYYYDPQISTRIEFGYAFARMFHVVVAPFYMLFFEQSGVNGIVGGDIGVRICF